MAGRRSTRAGATSVLGPPDLESAMHGGDRPRTSGQKVPRARLDRACHILMFPAACRHALCTVIPERRIWGMLHGRLAIGHCGLCRHRHPDTHRSRRPRTVTRTIMLRLRPHDLQVTRRCLNKTCFGSSLWVCLVARANRE
jgi:hypothetical protein